MYDGSIVGRGDIALMLPVLYPKTSLAARVAGAQAREELRSEQKIDQGTGARLGMWVSLPPISLQLVTTRR